jgi:hypothetical protein
MGVRAAALRKRSRSYPDGLPPAILRKRSVRNPLTWVAVVCIGAIAVAAAVDAIRSRDSTSPPRAASRTTTPKPAITDRLSSAPPLPPGATTGESRRQDWSRAVAEAADYKITEYTESAWVAERRGRSFYIWATEAIAIGDLGKEGFRVVRRVNGVPIYTDDIRLAWRAQRATVWLEAGPTGDSVAPKPTELRRLVRASIAIAIR